MRILATLAFFLLPAFANAGAYYAGADSRNDCYSYEQGDQNASCVYGATADAACQYYGSLLEAEGQGYPSYYPYYAGAANKCYRANDQSTTIPWVYNDLVACDNSDENGYCGQSIELCEDGLPPNINGYENCDRPDHKSCPDGSYVLISNVCSFVCFDHQTCLEYALSSSGCDTVTQNIEFQYINPETFSIQCTDIDPNSPDNVANGGNADGNIYNDPASDPEPDDAWYLAQTTAQHVAGQQQKQLSDIERTIREYGEVNRTGTNNLIDSVNQGTTTISNAISGLNGTAGDLEAGLNEVAGGVGDTNEKLDESNGILGTIRDVVQLINEGITELTGITGQEFSGEIFEIGDEVIQNFEQIDEDKKDFLTQKVNEFKQNQQITEQDFNQFESMVSNVIPEVQACENLTFPLPSGDNFTIQCEDPRLVLMRQTLMYGFYVITLFAVLDLIFIGASRRAEYNRKRWA